MSLIQTDLSESVPPREDTDDRKPKKWEEKRAAQQEAQRQVLSVLAQTEAHLGGIFSMLRRPPENDVKFSGALVVPAAGFLTLQWPERYATVSVANLSLSQLTVGHASSSATPPAVGAAVQRIAPGSSRTFALQADAITVWGAPGASFDLTVYQRPREPASGPCGSLGAGVLIAPGASATTTALLTAGGLGHLVAVLNVAVVPAAGSVQLTLNGVTPSGYVYPLLIGVAVTAVGVTPYRIGPGLNPSPNAVATDVVPGQVQAVVTVVGAGGSYGVDVVAG